MAPSPNSQIPSLAFDGGDYDDEDEDDGDYDDEDEDDSNYHVMMMISVCLSVLK